MYDVLIIGAGITGASIAMELSKYHLNIAWLEKHNDVAMETSKANSGIIHAGYDPKPGTLMAKLNVRGSRLFMELANKLNIHYQQIGSLVIAHDEPGKLVLRELYDRGLSNGVEGLAILDELQLRTLEPNLDETVTGALYAPSAAIISPWEACLAFAQTAVHNGVQLSLNTEVTEIVKNGDGYLVHSGDRSWKTKYVINCAGVHADRIFKMINRSEEENFHITPVKGCYYLLDKSQGKTVNHVIFQTPGAKGKGVLVSPTVHGNLIVGPDAEPTDKEDLSVGVESMQCIRNASRRTAPNINFRENVRNFAGLRAKIPGAGDFYIAESKSNPGFINFAGIQSPGLSCGPAFGEYAAELLRDAGCDLIPSESFALVPLKTPMREKSPEQINEMIHENPRYGRIICRCEMVSEGEIVDAVHGMIGAVTLDGVKRRTNSGMGRCQGGFCGPRILEIIRRESGCSVTEVCQDRDGSYIVAADKGGDCQ